MVNFEMFDDAMYPEIIKERGKYTGPIDRFNESDKKTLIFNCENIAEAKACVQSLKRYVDKRGYVMVVYRNGVKVWVIKA